MRDRKKETLFWLITPVVTVFDALLAGRKSGWKVQCLRANPVTNKISFSSIDFAQRMNRKFVLLGSRLYSPSFKGVARLAEAMVNF